MLRRQIDIAVIDYGAGNLRSASKALEFVARRAGLGLQFEVTSDPDCVASASRLVLPGVGAFAWCRRALVQCDGMIEALEFAVRGRSVPFLGICVGMQLMTERGYENGSTPGLGWISGETRPMTRYPGMCLPHMGWNQLHVARSHPVFAGVMRDGGAYAYFVHAYAVQSVDPLDCVLTAEYGDVFTAAIAHDTMVGTQFHPEKSQAVGLQILENFMQWKP